IELFGCVERASILGTSASADAQNCPQAWQQLGSLGTDGQSLTADSIINVRRRDHRAGCDQRYCHNAHQSQRKPIFGMLTIGYLLWRLVDARILDQRHYYLLNIYVTRCERIHSAAFAVTSVTVLTGFPRDTRHWSMQTRRWSEAKARSSLLL